MQGFHVILEDTILFPEGGGQVLSGQRHTLALGMCYFGLNVEEAVPFGQPVGRAVLLLSWLLKSRGMASFAYSYASENSNVLRILVWPFKSFGK